MPNGDTVLLEKVDGAIQVRPLKDGVAQVQANLRRYLPKEVSLSTELIADSRTAAGGRNVAGLAAPALRQPQALSRTTSRGGMTRLSVSAPPRRRTRRSTIAHAPASISCHTVVSGGAPCRTRGMSSNPTTASLAGARSEYNGAVGIARRGRTGWETLPPLVHADRVNNELERAHAVFHAGRYYLFWSTQRHTFAPELRHAPTGLYGMVANSLSGPYRPLNGGGLVLANPDDAPAQTYSWFVSRELVVSSFVDALPGTGAGTAAFGGVPAPLLRLAIDGDRCALAER